MDNDIPSVSVLVASFALLITAVAGLLEWSYRIWRASSYQRSFFSAELFAATFFSTLLTALFWYLFGFRQGMIAISLGTAWITAVLFPLGALSFYLTLLITRPWELLPDNPLIIALPKLFALTVLISWFVHKILHRDDRIFITSSFLCYLLLIVWILAASLFIGRFEPTLELMIQMFFPTTVIFFLLLQLPFSVRDLRFLQFSLVIGISATLGSMIFQSYTISEESMEFTRLGTTRGLFGNSNDLASLVVVAISLLFFPFYLNTKSLLSKTFAVSCLAFLASCLWLTQSRGGLLSVFGMGLAWFLISSKASGRFKKQVAAAIFISIPLVLSLFIMRDEGDLEGSSTSRMNYVIAGLRMAKSSPLFGVGLEQYPERYEQFTPSFVEWGTRTAHSSWVLVLSELGLPGIIIFIAIFFYTFKEVYSIRKTHPEYLLTFIGYGISMTFLSHSYLFLPYLIIGLFGAAARVISNNANKYAALVVLFSFVLLQPIFSSNFAYAADKMMVVSDLDKPFGADHKNLSNILKLSASRAETVGFFLRLPAGEECEIPLVKIRNNGDLNFKGGSRFSYLPYVKIENPSYPNAPTGEQLDPVLPLMGDKICLTSEGPSWLLGEIQVSKDSDSGEFKGEVVFGKNKLPIEFRIFKMLMPDTPSYPFYSEITTYWNLLGHHGKWSNDEARLAREYLRMARAHRVETLTTGISRPEVVSGSNGDQVLDLDNRPTPDQSFRAININDRSLKSYLGFPTIMREDVGSEKSLSYLSALNNTINSLQHKVMFYAWDEPAKEELPLLKKLLTDMRQRVPAARRMVTTPYKKELHDLVDIFVPVAEQIGGDYPGRPEYLKLQSEGKEFWWYVSCMSHGCEALVDSGAPDLVIDRPSIYVRSIGWLGPLLGTDAFLYYHLNHGYQYYPKRDPWQSLWDFSGNGDGTLLYPGRPGMFNLKEHTPVASLRLKLLQQASFDAEYIKWIESRSDKPAWWTDAKRNLVKDYRNWSKDYWKFAEVRRRIGEFLDAN